jgi:predicted molibdopterin-dependent oxidoreductase YjgC
MDANNLVIFYGAEGLTYEETGSLARMLANLLLLKQGEGDEAAAHAGRVNNGLIPVWKHANDQGAWDMGIHPAYGPGYAPVAEPGLDASAIYEAAADGQLRALYVAGADPIGDGLMDDRGQLALLVVQELFLTRRPPRPMSSCRPKAGPSARERSPTASAASSAITRLSRRWATPGPTGKSWPNWVSGWG